MPPPAPAAEPAPVAPPRITPADAPPPPRDAQPEPEPKAEPAPEAAREAAPAANDSLLRSDAPTTDRPGPVLGIDWGTPEDAIATLRANRMVVAIWRADRSGEGGTYQGRVEFVNGRWRREPIDPASLPRFARTQRRLDDVPAFNDARRAARLRLGERLVVLMPVEVERKLRASLAAAAADRGLAYDDVRVFAGRFRVRGGAVRFEIVEVVPH
ncbi:hypothetical protein [Phycisphaera mikurensis]|uniref:hypothetical protein n=1 Tax=Phycisphaera mikurensis TaxID=547188 RepID=UPI001614C896|nr:hypothetical protein [Phycisphaera mikurensis]MBB6441489.1 hypothetical protein [Phycisphaera mikurensis]